MKLNTLCPAVRTCFGVIKTPPPMYILLDPKITAIHGNSANMACVLSRSTPGTEIGLNVPQPETTLGDGVGPIGNGFWLQQ